MCVCTGACIMCAYVCVYVLCACMRIYYVYVHECICICVHMCVYASFIFHLRIWGPYDIGFNAVYTSNLVKTIFYIMYYYTNSYISNNNKNIINILCNKNIIKYNTVFTHSLPKHGGKYNEIIRLYVMMAILSNDKDTIIEIIIIIWTLQCSYHRNIREYIIDSFLFISKL